MGNDTEMSVEVLITSDDRLVAEALTHACRQRGFSAQGCDHTDAVPDGQPDVILVDLTDEASLPSWTARLPPGTRTVALYSAPPTPEQRERVDVWLPLATTVEILLDAVSGAATPGEELSVFVRSGFDGLGDLTPREHEVLVELLTGDGDPAIGERLGISEHTVRTHVQNILTKLGVNSRAAAASHALREGLLSPVPGVSR